MINRDIVWADNRSVFKYNGVVRPTRLRKSESTDGSLVFWLLSGVWSKNSGVRFKGEDSRGLQDQEALYSKLESFTLSL